MKEREDMESGEPAQSAKKAPKVFEEKKAVAETTEANLNSEQ